VQEDFGTPKVTPDQSPEGTPKNDEQTYLLGV